MNRVLGIIAEFNPFHNGHLYHLTESKKLSNCDYAICIMNGNFTQRGLPSLINKWDKTQMALKNGFDLVIELPTIYGISSAENFAYGSIKILNNLKIIDVLSFGSEVGTLDSLQPLADLFCDEPKEYISILKSELNLGVSFPKAREIATCAYLKDEKYKDILCFPNNILGIEYLKSLKKLDCPITPITIKRKISDYSSIEINSSFASSTAIRNLVALNKIVNIKDVMPETAYQILLSCIQNENYVLNLDAYEKIILYKLRTMSLEQIRNIPDISEGLEFVLKNAVNKCNSLSSVLERCKSKRFTYARLQRILLYVLLNITVESMNLSKNISPYVRILGVNSKGKKLLSEIRKISPDLPVITSIKDFEVKNKNSDLQKILDIDKRATDIYTLGYQNNSSYSNLDYTQKLIIN